MSRCRTSLQALLSAALLVAMAACSKTAPEQAQAAPEARVEASASSSTAAPADWKAMADFWARAMALPGIDTGPAASGKRMVIYFDPHCPACAQQWAALRPYLDQVRIHWVPVAYMDDTSAKHAAAMLAEKNPAEALASNEQAFDFSSNKGGYRPQTEPSAAAIAQITRNTQLARKAGDLMGTPTLGFELMRDQRYYKMTGVLEAEALRIAVSDLGNTMDPWAKHHGRVQTDAARSAVTP